MGKNIFKFYLTFADIWYIIAKDRKRSAEMLVVMNRKWRNNMP